MTNKVLEIPSYQEIYYICYLTQHGWEPDHGYYDVKEETEWFSLEDAYWKQKEKEE